MDGVFRTVLGNSRFPLPERAIGDTDTTKGSPPRSRGVRVVHVFTLVIPGFLRGYDDGQRGAVWGTFVGTNAVRSTHLILCFFAKIVFYARGDVFNTRL